MSSKSQRSAKIIDILKQNTTSTTKELATALGVSEMTVRRDIAELAKKNILDTYYGGIALKSNTIEKESDEQVYSFETEKDLHLEEKLRIARFASTMIEPFDSIAIDSGTTCCNILNYIPEDTACIIYTYSLEVINRVVQMNSDKLRLFAFGGYYHSYIKMFEYNEILSTIEKMHVNKLFLGTVGVSTAYGLSCSEPYEVAVRKALIDISDTVILLADSSKIGKSWFDHYADLDDVDIFITDSNLSSAQRTELEARKLKLYVV
ncbi:MAG: DeoR/GlpR family DNA-binding transcription regulator [Lachnospiraceae bacterium]|nr:DeoR/GlpR family DNA-binding transcription regulator [Lachnospiraceae bacterium]